MDNYSGHMSFYAAMFGLDVGLHPFGLVPHATNVMQPLDVCVFKTFKDFIAKVKRIVGAQEDMNWVVTQNNYPLIIHTGVAMMKMNPQLFRKAFATCGIFPHNPNPKILDKLPLPPVEVNEALKKALDVNRQPGAPISLTKPASRNIAKVLLVTDEGQLQSVDVSSRHLVLPRQLFPDSRLVSFDIFN